MGRQLEVALSTGDRAPVVRPDVDAQLDSVLKR